MKFSGLSLSAHSPGSVSGLVSVLCELESLLQEMSSALNWCRVTPDSLQSPAVSLATLPLSRIPQKVLS